MQNTTYLLAIKRDNKDYLPLEWNVLENYEGEDLTSLQGIDKYTKKMDEFDLLKHVLDENRIDDDEKFRKFVIIYKEKGRNRELKEEPIFIDRASYLDFNIFIEYLFNNIDNKDLLNQIYNIINNKQDYKSMIEFTYIIKNIEYFKNNGDNVLKVALSKFNELEYIDKRRIAININERFINYKDNDKLLKKEVA